MQIAIITTLLIAMAGGCKKPSPKPVSSDPVKNGRDTTLSIIWQSKYGGPNEDNFHKYISYYNNEIIIAPHQGSVQYQTLNLDANNGNLKNNLGICNYEGEFLTFEKNKIASYCNNKIAYFDLNNKKSIFEYTRNIQNNRGDNDFIVAQNSNHLLRTVTVLQDSSFMVLRSKWQTSTWDTIYNDRKFFKNFEIFPSFNRYWMAPNGDSILVMMNQMLERGTGNNRLVLIAYNLTQKNNYWYLPDYDPAGLGRGLIIKDNKLFVTGPRILYCYDLVSKQKVWQHNVMNDDIGEGFGGYVPEPIFEGNCMYVKTGNNYGYCFDKNSGAIIWQNDNVKTEFNSWKLHKGVLYGMGYFLMGIRASDGKVVLFSYSPNFDKENCKFSQGLDIDPATDRLFCADSRYVYAIDISRFNQ